MSIADMCVQGHILNLFVITYSIANYNQPLAQLAFVTSNLQLKYYIFISW